MKRRHAGRNRVPNIKRAIVNKLNWETKITLGSRLYIEVSRLKLRVQMHLVSAEVYKTPTSPLSNAKPFIRDFWWAIYSPGVYCGHDSSTDQLRPTTTRGKLRILLTEVCSLVDKLMRYGFWLYDTVSFHSDFEQKVTLPLLIS